MARSMRRPMLGGAVYVLPNLLTTGNLFFGFFSIVKALQGQFVWAAPAILLAALFDVLDGRVARLTRGTSEFGVQYDSLCDVVSFGVAPAFMMYQFGLGGLGRMGYIACFLFMACGALRLARFNVQSSIGKASGDFTGLPIPMAAIVIACFVSFVTDLEANPLSYFWLPQVAQEYLVTERFRQMFMLIAGPALALAMVSNVVYRSHKALKIRSVKPFKVLVIVVVITAFLAYQPETLGFLLVLTYALSGPFEWILGWKKPTDDDEIFEPQRDDDDSSDEFGDSESSLKVRKGDIESPESAVRSIGIADSERDKR